MYLMVFLKEFSEKVDFEKIQHMTEKLAKLPSTGKELQCISIFSLWDLNLYILL